MNKASILAFSLVALILRFLSMQGELWLDEVWAITTVLSKSSIQDIFNFTTFDGHASLYSLFYRLIGSTLPEITKSWWLYRLPSFIASLGSLWLFVKIADKRSSFFIFFLVSFSFLLNLYGTEARGYSLCIFFSLLSYYQLNQYLQKQKPVTVQLFFIAASSLTAFLFHPSAAIFYGSLVLWSLYDVRNNRKKVLALLCTHTLSLIVVFSIYFFYLAKLPSGDGPMRPYWQVLISLLSMTFGGAQFSKKASTLSNITTCSLALLVLALFISNLYRRYRQNDTRWLLYFLAVIVSPLSFLLIIRPEIFMIRYFLLSICCLYLCIAQELVALAKGSQKQLAGIVSLLFMVLNCGYLVDLVTVGRGQYVETIKYMLNQTRGQTVKVGGDRDFQTTTMLSFYTPHAFNSLKRQKNKNIQYIPRDTWESNSPDWVLSLTLDNYISPKKKLELHDTYLFKEEFSFTALSGWRWFVYRRE